MEESRIVFLDWLRVIACFMVMLVHSIEPFYLDDAGTYIATLSDGFWCTVLNSPLRSAVPLFVIASSYLLFPLRQPTVQFFRRRIRRVLLPLLVWLVVYTLLYLPGNTFWTKLPFNFHGSQGHLWFVYMLLGVYILMPLLSPWAERVSKRGELWFLGAWAFTTLVPYIRQASVALNGSWAVWGEANWNEFGTLYYISGFVGYLVLGHYFRTYVKDLNWKRTLLTALPCLLVGYAVNAFGFWHVMPDEFPVRDEIRLAVNMETTWRFCSFGVAAMTVGYFLLIRKITSCGAFYRHVVLPISKVSYGMYLMHIIVLIEAVGLLRPRCISLAGDFWGMPLCVISSAAVTFAVTAAVSLLLKRIPKVGDIIIG